METFKYNKYYVIIYAWSSNDTVRLIISDGNIFNSFSKCSREEYDGDTVYINDSKAYITATPHTIVGDGWVEFGVTAKTFTGDLNVLFGFNNEYIKPTKAEYYNPHDVQQSYVCSEEFNYTLNPNYFYCNSENGTTIFEHSFDTGNISTQTAYWNENEDWSSLNKETTKISYNYDGKNTWRVLQNVPFTSGVEQKVRVWLETPSLPTGKTAEEAYPDYDAKYDFAVYPSSYGLTVSGIGNAISTNNFYLLDLVVNLTDGLTAHYDFETGSGTVLEDLIGVNDFAMSSITWNGTSYPTYNNSGDGSNYSIQFDGVSDEGISNIEL